MCFFGTRLGSKRLGYGHLGGAHAAVEKGQHDEMPRLDDAGNDQGGEKNVEGELQRVDVAQEPAALELVGKKPRDRRHEKQRNHRGEGRDDRPIADESEVSS